MELSNRKKALIALIVKGYNDTGEPVGSKALCETLGNISSATIRNEMSDLTELGYLSQPHTSAGRVPTAKAYRLYIDSLMVKHNLTVAERGLIDSLLPSRVDDYEQALRTAIRALSDATRCAALVTSEADSGTLIHRIELIPMGSYAALLVVLTSTGMVSSRMIRLRSQLNPALSERFINITNAELVGTEMKSLHPAALQTLVASAGDYALELAPLMSALANLISSACEAQLEVTGETKLLNYSEFPVSKMREIFDILSRRDEIITLLDMRAGDAGVILGEDTSYEALSMASMIVAKYHMNTARSGYIGVIGPVRMDYERIIPSIEYFAQSLGALALGQTSSMKGLI